MNDNVDNVPRKRTADLLIGLAMFAWPFLFFFRMIVPGCPWSLEIGNDFIPLYYTYKIYLLDWLSAGHLPLWSPAEGCGFPFYSNPFTQTFYPLNIPLVLIYVLRDGFSVFDYQAYAVTGIGIYSLGTYLWLNRLTGDRRAAVFAALVISVSFKMGEILRFPNAVHTAAWMPWMLYGLTLAGDRKRSATAVVTLFAACVMMLTAGYFYYVYYSLFLVPPYMLVMLIPALRAAFVKRETSEEFSYRHFWWSVIPSLAGGVLLCLPYLLKVHRLLGETAGRGGWSYDTVTAWGAFKIPDTVGSLVFPPLANAEGWYYFGIFGVLLIAVYMVNVAAGGSARGGERLFALLLICWWLFISAVTYGGNSYLFNLLWNYMPGFTTLRMWPRCNIVLLPILAMFLARAYDRFEHGLSGEQAGNAARSGELKRSLAAAVIAAGCIFAVQAWILKTRQYDQYWNIFFTRHHGIEWTFLLGTFTSLSAFLLVLGLGRRQRPVSPGSRALILAGVVAVAVADLYPVGSAQWSGTPADGHGSARTRLNLSKLMAESFSTPRIKNYYTITEPRFNVGLVADWYFDRYVSFDRTLFPGREFSGVLWYGIPMEWEIEDNAQLTEDYGEFMGLKGGRKVFVSRRIDHKSTAEFMRDSGETEKTSGLAMDLKTYDGDQLDLYVETPEPVYVSFIDNWDPDWRAEVNGKPVAVAKLFGTFKSVWTGQGRNTVRFAYRPFR
jgi:hypothetical protein